ncbi:UDP-N-acetylmuramoylalanine--D-glutamate ligase [Candidatus Levyibacteriota bacterium]|nr:UDP-N-acetylmuramoylalanine--D-glutamate ligase [Candidatus Levybacteria bacterium]
MITDWKNKKVAIIGYGVEGKSSAVYLAEKGAIITILDRQNVSDEIDKLIGNITLRYGDDYLDNLELFDVIIRSPGIKRNISALLKAEKKGIVIISQTQLFFDLCPCKIIGVTGTKGKGTTASLIYEMLKKDEKDVYIGGNIGNAPLDFLNKLTPQSIVVLEMSSYQLQDLTKSPHIAVMLMVTSEHLAPDRNDELHQNYHENLEEYVDAKRNILRFQLSNDYAIINRDYIAANESDTYTDGQVFRVSRERQTEQGCYVRENAIWLNRDGNEIKIINTEDILLPGGHNWENVCASVIAASLIGVSNDSMRKVLKIFQGLPHRLELIANIGGASYYNDSFSTTPETAIAAIYAFSKPEIIILGGAHKGSDFKELGKVISESRNIKAIIGIGLEWPRIKQAIELSSKDFRNKNLLGNNPRKSQYNKNNQKFEIIEGCKSMDQVVRLASTIAESGDVVLLSPACSSFDMFPNYKVRGEQFSEEVRRLQK